MNKKHYCSLIRTPLSDKLYCTLLFRLDLYPIWNNNTVNSISPMAICSLMLYFSFSQTKVRLNLPELSIVLTINLYLALFTTLYFFYKSFKILETGYHVISKLDSIFIFFSRFCFVDQWFVSGYPLPLPPSTFITKLFALLESLLKSVNSQLFTLWFGTWSSRANQ